MSETSSLNITFPADLDEIILAFGLRSLGRFISLRDSIDSSYFEDQEVSELFNHVKNYYAAHRSLPTASVLRDFLTSLSHIGDTAIRRICTKYDYIGSRNVEDSKIYSEFDFYLTSVKKRFALKAYQGGITKSLESLEQDANLEEAVREVEKMVSKIRGAESDRVIRVEASEIAQLAISKYEAIEANPQIAAGVRVGFASLDKASNGIQNGELWLVVGGTGMGKSITLNAMAANAYNGINYCSACKEQLFRINDAEMNCIYCGNTIRKNDTTTYIRIEGKNVAYITIEMPGWSEDGPADVYDRMMAASTDLPIHDIQRGGLSKVHKSIYIDHLKNTEKYENKLFIIDVPRGVSAEFIEGEVDRKLCEYPDHPIDLIVVDYLNIMTTNDGKGAGSDWLVQGQIAEQLHEVGRSYKIPIISAGQATSKRDKSVTQEGGHAGTHRVARGEMIAHNCNAIFQIDDFAKDEEASELDNIMQFHATKFRNAKKFSFPMYKDFSRMQITNYVNLGYAEYRKKLKSGVEFEASGKR